MAEYHVSCGMFGIYAGIFKKKKDRSKMAKEEGVDEWLAKSEVTDEALAAAAEYLLTSNKLFRFLYKGQPYKLHVESCSASEFTKIKEDGE